jgi:hypothetical protein
MGEGSTAGAAEGFIWMIFLVRVGGGGRANGSRGFGGAVWADVRFLPVVLREAFVGVGCDSGEWGWYEEAEDDDVSMLEVRESDAKAGGGSSKDMWEATKAEPSRPLRSVDEAGVGGRVGRGICAIYAHKMPGDETGA